MPNATLNIHCFKRLSKEIFQFAEKGTKDTLNIL